MIDVHAHFLPAFYRDALANTGHAQPDGFPHIPDWSAHEHIEAMDRLDITTSLLSISSPGVHLGPGADTVSLTRAVNEAGHEAVQNNPGRFGHFASLPLPDVDASITEIAHCSDNLNVNGFTLLTNVEGTYLGDPILTPIFSELNKRRSRVFIHPTSPACWEHTSLGRPRPMIEFLFDTTRAVVDLILNGIIAEHPQIEFIVPHAGATLPMIADRVEVFAMLLEVDRRVNVMADLARLHFDLAGYPLPRQLDALLTLTNADHLHYGSDYPFTPEFAVAASSERLTKVTTPCSADLLSNTLTLFPELRS